MHHDNFLSTLGCGKSECLRRGGFNYWKDIEAWTVFERAALQLAGQPTYQPKQCSAPKGGYLAKSATFILITAALGSGCDAESGHHLPLTGDQRHCKHQCKYEARNQPEILAESPRRALAQPSL